MKKLIALSMLVLAATPTEAQMPAPLQISTYINPASPTFSGNVTAATFSPTGSSCPPSNNGMYLSAANSITICTNATAAMTLTSASISVGRTIIGSSSANSGTFINQAASATAPTFAPNRAASTTGIGAQASGNVSIIATGTEIVRVTATGPVLVTIPADTATADATLCRATSGGAMLTGTGTAGICLGTSTARAKEAIVPLMAGLSAVMSLKPVSFRYRAGWGYPTKKTYYGFTAEDMQPVVSDLVGKDSKGRPVNADYLGLVPVLVKAVQEQQVQIAALKKKLAERK